MTPELFLKLPSKCQDTLAGLCGLTGWGPTLVHQISLAFEDKPLPSPLEMRWQGVPCILMGTIPAEHSTPIILVEPLLESLKTYMKWADKLLTNTTEMEANARVLLLVLDAVSQCNDVMINLQPSVDGHPVFTNF